MKIIKSLFTIYLLNFLIMFGVVYAAKIYIDRSKAASTSVPERVTVTATPMLVPSVELTVTKKPRQVIYKKVYITDTPAPGAVSAPGNQVVVTATPPAAASAAPTAAPVVDNRCIVTVDGVRWDATNFRHPGGPLPCGSDISAAFHNQHPDSYLARYLTKI